MERISKGIYKYFVSVMVFMFLISGCQSTPTQENCDGYRFGSGHPEYPEYIYQVWPVPDGKFSQACYQESINQLDTVYRGIGIYLYIRHIDTQFSDDSTPLPIRVKLYVDGLLLPNTSILISVTGEIVDQYRKSYNPPIPEQIMMSWVPDLGVGKHEARIEITRDNGEVLEYSWSFKVTR
jgi:hypothetical protein